MSKVNLMTKAEYARHRGCSRVSVGKAVKEGRISEVDGKIDPAVADVQWQQNSRARVSQARPAAGVAMPGKPDEASGPADYWVSRGRREAAEAEMAEMKEAEMRGKFLKKTEVDSAIFEIARALRDGLTNCARRIAADVAALTSAEDCEAVIDREHRALLDNMSHRITSKLGAPEREG